MQILTNTMKKSKIKVAHPKQVLGLWSKNPSGLFALSMAYDFGFITFKELQREREKKFSIILGGKYDR